MSVTSDFLNLEITSLSLLQMTMFNTSTFSAGHPRGLSPMQRERQFKPHEKFTRQDDEQLRDLVEVYGTCEWGSISEQMKGKNARQCRERWFNYLCPQLNTAAWTLEEDLLLLQKYAEIGNKWVKIAKFFKNRTDSIVKNRFNKLQRNQQKLLAASVMSVWPLTQTQAHMRSVLQPQTEPLPFLDASPIVVEGNPGDDFGLGSQGSAGGDEAFGGDLFGDGFGFDVDSLFEF
jgi:hypothetical protein